MELARWYWKTHSAYSDPSSTWNDLEGWHGTGPDGSDRLENMWVHGEVGDTLTLTISPMVAVKLELVATLSSGMIFCRKTTPHVIYCVKKLLPYKLYQVELDLKAKKLAFHTLIGDEVHTCDFKDHMLWEQVREELADHLGVQTWQIRFIHNGWVGQRNMQRPIIAPLVEEDRYVPKEFDPSEFRVAREASPKARAKAKAKAHPKAKAKAHAKAKAMPRAIAKKQRGKKGESKAQSAKMRRPAAQSAKMRRPAAQSAKMRRPAARGSRAESV